VTVVESNEVKTDPPGDPLVGILSELTSAIERNTELCLSIMRLLAANDLEAHLAVRNATISAAQAALAAKAAEAAVNVFAENAGTLNANIQLLRNEVRRVLGRVSGMEMALDEDRIAAEPPSKTGKDEPQ
jgi:hypothetical protein